MVYFWVFFPVVVFIIVAYFIGKDFLNSINED